MLDNYRRVRRIVGRRDAIRYGGLGLLSLALTACGAKKDDGRSGKTPDGAPGKAKATVTGAAVEAFARGAWKLSFTPQGQVNDEYARIEITGRRWSLDDGDEAGSFELTGDRLTVTVDGMTSDNVWAGAGLPGSVGDEASHTLQWGHDAKSGEGDPGSPVDTTPFPLPITWDGTTLRIQAKNGVLITAVRA
ncbi:hypothetical protein [Streptomyces sp. B1I3]|uniref:hypothetical protein n=1 Tax=Streptomyces sp. B1I3 TaxID=3042264 RepID=UPI00277FB470|nr:hypothetical protein [Streptomyces sp. B1I3]MDQ0796192.1 hypothetical protein [Streptomyces sp. B1I3]